MDFMDLYAYIQNAWGKCQSLGNRGTKCPKLHHKVRMLHHQDTNVVSEH